MLIFPSNFSKYWCDTTIGVRTADYTTTGAVGTGVHTISSTDNPQLIIEYTGGNSTTHTVGIGGNSIIEAVGGDLYLDANASVFLRDKNLLLETDGGGNIGAAADNRPDYIYAVTEIISGINITAGNNFLASAGVAASPGFTFTEYPTTGVYASHPGAVDILNFSIETNQICYIAPGGFVVAGTGSVTSGTGGVIVGDTTITDGALADATGFTFGTTAVDINAGVITGITDLLVADGGTGASTLTDHGILLGSGTNAVTALAEAADGELPIGDTDGDPILNTLTADTGITIANAAGSITIAATFEADKIKFTTIGGLAIKLTNETGAASVKGELVETSQATDDAVKLAAADSQTVVGCFLDASVAEHAEAWIVISGIADVLYDAAGASGSHGDYVKASGSIAGRAFATQTQPSDGGVETIGHSIEDGVNNTLGRIVMHFQ